MSFDTSKPYWVCGDCGTPYHDDVYFCTRPFDDYLSLRGGSIESAILRAVDEAVNPLVRKALRRLSTRPAYTTSRFITTVNWIA